MIRSLGAAYVATMLFVGPHLGLSASADDGLMTEDLTSPLTIEEVVDTLLGPEMVASNIAFVGDPHQIGVFGGGDGIIGFDEGIVLSSGSVSQVVGPNLQPGTTGVANWAAGDPDVAAVAGTDTFDAAVLEFDFELTSSGPSAEVAFHYVFSSEEYNESVYTDINDAMVLMLDGQNCARVGNPLVGVSINTINNGSSFFNAPPSNPALFRNNELNSGGGSINTEMDGLTVVLTCEATLTTGTTHHAKIAIADAWDDVYDSNVFLQGGPLGARRETALTANPLVSALPTPTSSLPQLSARLTTADGAPIGGKTVTFFAGTMVLCSGETNTSG
ncbi:MAG TPA: choice-of-anchor L domain-containing protein, partial [Acidimicrobiia bacterium]|nr:choice-of-anchor L domain-containing protein [Acidimicrobiia bacterium]